MTRAPESTARSRRTRRGSPWRLAACIGALALGGGLAGGCGIPLQQSAQPIASDLLPEPVRSASPPAGNPSTGGVHVEDAVYFTTAGAFVVPEPRYFKPHATVGTVVTALLDGPTQREYAEGVQTALGGGIHLLSWKVSGDTVTVDFTETFLSLSGTQEVLGVAQVVYTIASFLDPAYSVLFETTGDPIFVPVGTGALVSGKVHVSEYTSLLSPTSPAATVAP